MEVLPRRERASDRLPMPDPLREANFHGDVVDLCLLVVEISSEEIARALKFIVEWVIAESAVFVSDSGGDEMLSEEDESERLSVVCAAFFFDGVIAS